MADLGKALANSPEASPEAPHRAVIVDDRGRRFLICVMTNDSGQYVNHTVYDERFDAEGRKYWNKVIALDYGARSVAVMALTSKKYRVVECTGSVDISYINGCLAEKDRRIAELDCKTVVSVEYTTLVKQRDDAIRERDSALARLATNEKHYNLLLADVNERAKVLKESLASVRMASTHILVTERRLSQEVER